VDSSGEEVGSSIEDIGGPDISRSPHSTGSDSGECGVFDRDEFEE
jgi:hypothetical protein